MVPIRLKKESDRRFPEFWLFRAVADLQLEPTGPEIPLSETFVDSALLDTGAGYLTIPHRVHQAQRLRIYQDFGPAPYRITSSSEPPILQRFVEIGLRFLVLSPDAGYSFWPEQFVRAKAYLLDANQAPKVKVLVGLDVILEHFVMHLDKDNAYLAARAGA